MEHGKPARRTLRLKVCNLNQCEARCCYDGVYLRDGEDEMITRLVETAPSLFPDLPRPFIVDGEWQDRRGPKTAIVPRQYKDPEFPAHFTRTGCVFLSADHRCQLQMAGERLGFHKWTFKPATCWLYPLHVRGPEIVPPPTPNEPDPDDIGGEYPGYIKFTVCGSHKPDGEPWRRTLKQEIAYLAKNPTELTWRRLGMSLEDLMQLVQTRLNADEGGAQVPDQGAS